MYYPTIHQRSQALTTLEVWLDKTTIHAGGHDSQAGLSAQAQGEQSMSAITSRPPGNPTPGPMPTKHRRWRSPHR